MTFVCGLDEAGRGPLAGPVAAGAVILPEDFPFEILNDSKKLSEKKRLQAELVIKEKACWAVALVENDVIDRINILQASLLAMKNAFEQMCKKLPEWAEKNGILIPLEIENSLLINAIVDGNFCPEISYPCVAEPKADCKYPQVMAASILAKVQRDRIMVEYDKIYSQYGYAKHKGYPTAYHREICRKIGPSPIQRLSFNY
ncbi:ribonuclease HII [Treponema pectinovorum]|uniref:ribonuclease HII n=1 Tax=Treponema pectinovorum TaxID=164 RepID=UPI003D8E3877